MAQVDPKVAKGGSHIGRGGAISWQYSNDTLIGPK